MSQSTLPISENLLRVFLRSRNWTKATERLAGLPQFQGQLKKPRDLTLFGEPCDWFWLVFFIIFFWYLVSSSTETFCGWFEELKLWLIMSTLEARIHTKLYMAKKNKRGCHIAVLSGTRAVKPCNLGVVFSLVLFLIFSNFRVFWGVGYGSGT